MTPVLLSAIAISFVLGVSVGLRTFTALAVLLFALHYRIAAAIVAVLALGEWIMDVMPNTPSRTAPVGLGARLVSGAVVGWLTARAPGLVAGVLGALAGTYIGHDLRLKAITRIGALPAALTEDAIALGIAIVAVSRLTP
jgi:uncharacterized membrane protein